MTTQPFPSNDAKPGPYAVSYDLPDVTPYPVMVTDIVRAIMEEGLFHPGDFTRHEWKRVPFAGGDCWQLTTFPWPDPSHPQRLLIALDVVNAEMDPDKALILAWRWRGQKKATMRSLAEIVERRRCGEVRSER